MAQPVFQGFRPLIVSAGRHGRLVADIRLACDSRLAGFVGDDKWGSTVLGPLLLGGMLQLERIARPAGARSAVAAIGEIS